VKNSVFKNRALRSKIFAGVTVAAIVLLFGLNLLMTHLGLKGSLYIDMTPEGFYTLTELMKSECDFIDSELDGENKVTITFCSDPDTLIDSETTRLTYFMALQLDSRYENLEVKTVNVNYNPTAVQEYKPTSLSTISPTDIIISYGSRYRVIGADNFWVTAEDELYSYNGEFKMATIIKSVTAKERPAAYFVTDHGETYFDPDNPSHPGNAECEQLYYLLLDRGLEIKTHKLSEGDVPEDCVLLIINDPKTDFVDENPDLDSFGYISQTERLDRYLVRDYGSVMLAKDFANSSLPVLEAFLYNWGFDFSSSRVTDPDSYLSSDKSMLVGAYDTDENGYAYAIYGEFAALESAPKPVVTNSGYITCSFGEAWSTPEHGTYSITRNYAPIVYSGDNAEAHRFDKATGDYTDLDKEASRLELAAVTSRVAVDGLTSEYRYSYLMCAASGEFFSNELLGEASYANYDILSALAENMIRSDEYASTDLGGTSLNSASPGGKPIVDVGIYDKENPNPYSDKKQINGSAKGWITAAAFVAPVAILCLGIFVAVRRRFL